MRRQQMPALRAPRAGDLTMPLLAGALAAALLLLIAQDVLRTRALARLAPPAAPPAEGPLVSVVIPARDEAARLGACLAGLAAQRYRRFEVLVVDDHSTDGTAALAGSFGPSLPALAVVPSAALPPGWAGKSWACWQGAGLAAGELLLFLDADVAPLPDLLGALVGASRRADLVSLLPLVEMGSLAERLVLPAFFQLVAAIYPLALVNDDSSPLAFAIGQCILVRREAYRALGGHRAVRGSLLEDMELAGLAKRAGLRLRAAEAPDLIRVRMYDGWRSVAEGLSKNAAAGFGNSAARSALAALRQLAVAWLPLDMLAAGLLAGDPRLAAAGAALSAAGACASAWAVRRRFRLPAAWGLLLPAGTLAYLLIAAAAAARLRLGLGVSWKGRRFGARRGTR